MEVIERIANSLIRQEYIERTFMQMTLSSSQTPWKNVYVDC